MPQHVLQRGNNRLATFFRDANYESYLECLRRASSKRRCAAHAYVLMTNHVHLLVTPRDDESNSLMMQDVGRDYVQYVNATYRRSGTLWEGRFKATLVDTTTYFLTCMVPGFLGGWIAARLTAWLFAFPIVLLAASLARRAAQRLVAVDAK